MNVFSHSGDLADVIYHLPLIKQNGGGKLILFPASCTEHRMTPERAELLASLLRVQPYLSGVEWKEYPEGINLDGWREHPAKGLNVTDMACKWAGLPHPDREQPWLFVEQKRVARVVFHRSSRHHNWNFPWKRVYETYGKEAVFVGHPTEHADFCHFVGPISYLYTPTLLDLAHVIAGCELFIGNQDVPYAVAEGLKVPTIVERIPNPNNCHWERVGNIHGWDEAVSLPALTDLPENLVQSTVARAKGHTLISKDRLAMLARWARELAPLPGDMAELGVYQGGSAKVLASMVPEKTLHLFDTFQGIPADDAVAGGHKKGDFAANAEEVRDYLCGYKVMFNVGRFPETTSHLASTARFSLVHLDADIYQSTLDGIQYFWPKIVPGGLLVFDDYKWKNCPGVEKAIEEMLPDATLEVGNLQAWVRKQ